MSLQEETFLGPRNSLDKKQPVSKYNCISLQLRYDYDVARQPSDVRKSEEKAIVRYIKDVRATGNFYSRIAATKLMLKNLIESLTGVLYPLRFHPVVRAVTYVAKVAYEGPRIPLGHGTSVSIGLKDLGLIMVVLRKIIKITKLIPNIVNFLMNNLFITVLHYSSYILDIPPILFHVGYAVDSLIN